MIFPNQLPANVLVFGGGNMGFAIAKGILGGNLPFLKDLAVIESSEPRREYLTKNYVKTVADFSSLTFQPNVVFVAVKPQSFNEILPDLRELNKNKPIFASCMAGISYENLCHGLITSEPDSKDKVLRKSDPKICRFMPNLAASVGHSATGVFYGPNLDIAERMLIRELVTTFGSLIPVEIEEHIDIVTAIAGSGPAYFALILELMIEVSKELGINEQSSNELAFKTLNGLSQFFIFNPSISPSELIKMVSSPQGTTEKALQAMRDNGVPEGIKTGIIAAFNRSKELGGKVS
jgi:pyrroline-5-carboxylate reductase